MVFEVDCVLLVLAAIVTILLRIILAQLDEWRARDEDVEGAVVLGKEFLRTLCRIAKLLLHSSSTSSCTAAFVHSRRSYGPCSSFITICCGSADPTLPPSLSSTQTSSRKLHCTTKKETKDLRMSAMQQHPPDPPTMITLDLSWVEKTKDLVNGWPSLTWEVPSNSTQDTISTRVRQQALEILSTKPGMARAKLLLGSHLVLDPANTDEPFRNRAWQPEDPLHKYLKADQTRLTGNIHVYLFQDLDFSYRAKQIYDVLQPLDWVYTPMSDSDPVSKMRFKYHTVERLVAIGRTRKLASSTGPDDGNVVVIKFQDDYEGINLDVFFVTPWTVDGKLPSMKKGDELVPCFLHDFVVTRKDFKWLAKKKLRIAVASCQDAVYERLVQEGRIEE